MTVNNKRNKYSIIHVAKKQLGLDDDAYRAVLAGAGISSSKDIKTTAQFNTVMSAFQQLGFKSTWIGKPINKVTGAPGMISKRQEYYIKGLWQLASHFKDEASLRKIVKRIGKVDDISFLPKRSASAVILALRDICWKAGFNPDKKEGINVYNSKGSGFIASNGTASNILSPDDGRDRIDQARQSMAAGAGSGK